MPQSTTLSAVADFMTKAPVTLQSSMSIEEALVALERLGFPGAPVVDGGLLVGVLSELDCAKVLATAAFHALPAGTVADHMSRDVDAASPEDDVFTLAQRFQATRHHWLPVADSSGALVGRVSLRELFTVLARLGAAEGRRPEQTAGAAWDPAASAARDRKS